MSTKHTKVLRPPSWALCGLLLAITLPATAQFPTGARESIFGHSGSTYSKAQFQDALLRAATQVRDTREVELANGTLYGIDSTEELNDPDAQGSWRIVLTGYRKDGNTVNYHKTPCVITNYGNGFQYLWLSQEIPPFVFDAIVDKQEKRHTKIRDKHKDVEVEIGRHEDKILMTAAYAYTEDTDRGDIEGRLEYYMNQSRDIINATMEDVEKALEEHRKKLEDEKLSTISPVEFQVLVDDDLEDLLKDHAEAEGWWEFNFRDVAYEIFSYGDRLVFSISLKMPDGLSDSQRAAILAAAQEKAEDKPAKDASETEVLWYPGYSNYLWWRATYPLDGDMKGKDLAKYYHEFVYKYGKDRDKDLRKIVDKNT